MNEIKCDCGAVKARTPHSSWCSTLTPEVKTKTPEVKTKDWWWPMGPDHRAAPPAKEMHPNGFCKDLTCGCFTGVW